MKLKQVLLLISLLLAAFSQAKKKNVLVFVVDDGGFLQTAYNNTVCESPNVDKLASRSIVFRNGYTSVSSCSPSRSVLLTGLPQHQNGMYGLHHSVHHFNSFDAVKSLPNVLTANGVRTGLIGKKHVGPDYVYKFDYERSNEQYNIDQIGRNITFMNGFVHEFLNQPDERSFLLYIGFFDTHRGDPQSKLGPFKEKWGSRLPGMGNIPDYKPHFYDPKEVDVPFFLPDTIETRKDLASMYASYTRMDQGIGLFMSELEKAGHLNDTLILFTGDNGIPFPNAKTTLYEPGNGVPMMMSSPLHPKSWGTISNAKANTMDFVPTIYNWLNITYPSYKLNGFKVKLSGKSLLPLLGPDTSNHGNKLESVVTMFEKERDPPGFDSTFSSHNFHEVTMFYPMRVIRSGNYRLIHNLNYKAPYALATDIFSSPTMQAMFNRTRHGEPLNWFKTWDQYYHRAEWELFNLVEDPHELHNKADNATYKDIFTSLKDKLTAWQADTGDYWICLPHQMFYGNKCHDAYYDL